MFSLASTMPSHPTLDVEFGIGTTRSAFPARTDGSSTPTRFVRLFLISVLLMTTVVLASPAIRDMT